MLSRCTSKNIGWVISGAVARTAKGRWLLGEIALREGDLAGAERANARSAELRGLLHELQREHTCNRALMQIELGFLDHLMGMLALDGVNGYDTRGSSRSITRSRPHGALHVLDLHA